MVKELARLNSTNIVFLGNKNVLPLVRRFIELKAYSTMSTLMCGPSRVPSKGGANYFVTFIADFCQKVWVYMLKHKSEVSGSSNNGRCSLKIKRMRTDNGMKFCSYQFDEFFRDEGIARHRTVRHTITKWCI